MKPQDRKIIPRKDTREDKRQVELTAAGAAGIKDHLRTVFERNRDAFVRDLTPRDLECMSNAAICAYVQRRAEMEMEDELFDDELPEIAI